MTFKAFWQTTRTAFVIKNFLAAIGIVLLFVAILLVWLRRYTQHGVEVEVPEVVGLFLVEAEPLVEDVGMKLVVVDSTYSSKVPLGTIVEQNPPAMSHAKHDRSLYVIINASTRRQVSMPDLHDASYRQAEATLKSLGIVVSEMVYEPSEYKDLVLDVRVGEKSIEPGDRVAEGTKVVLVIGRGKGTEMVAVPNLQGRTLQESRSLLLSYYLTMGVTAYDEEPTDETRDQYVVYYQEPSAGTMILEGSHVDVRLSVDLEKAITSGNLVDEEDFF